MEGSRDRQKGRQTDRLTDLDLTACQGLLMAAEWNKSITGYLYTISSYVFCQMFVTLCDMFLYYSLKSTSIHFCKLEWTHTRTYTDTDTHIANAELIIHS